MKNTGKTSVMNNFSFNIICTSLGRPTLLRLLNSLNNQLTKNDKFTLISDDNHELISELIKNNTFTYPINHIVEHNGPSGNYGHSLLNKYINELDGDFIMFADDDDRYTPDAFETIREVVTDRKLYLFKHKWGNTINWSEKVIKLGNIGKCMGVIPNTKTLPKFELSVFGDGLFYEELSKNMDYEFINKIIYKVRDTE